VQTVCNGACGSACGSGCSGSCGANCDSVGSFSKALGLREVATPTQLPPLPQVPATASQEAFQSDISTAAQPPVYVAAPAMVRQANAIR
jgi:hypothetical protein